MSHARSFLKNKVGLAELCFGIFDVDVIFNKTISMLKVFFLFILAAFHVSCTSPQEDRYRVGILLNPKFPITLGLNDSDLSQSQLMDNDGNMYITYWDVPIDSYDAFSLNAEECRASIKDRRLFSSSYSIHDYDINDIQPTLFKPHVACLHKAGYELVESVAYSPEYFDLSFSRTHSKSDHYIPVGARYRIERSGAQYIEAYTDILNCEKQVISSGYTAEETYDYNFGRVSIEMYVEKFQSCLRNIGYKVENNSYIFR